MFLLLCVLVSAAFADQFEQIAALTCEGDLFVYPDHPNLSMRFDLSNAKTLFEDFVQRLYVREKIVCPDLSTEEFASKRAYMTPEFWANVLTKRDMNSSCTNWQPTGNSYYDPLLWAIQHLLDSYDLSFLDWSTCNWDTYTSGAGCTMQYHIQSLGISLRAAIKKCGATFAPYASVTCSGALCSRFFMPCTTDADCGGVRCHGVGYYNYSDPLVSLRDLLETLRIAYFADTKDGDDTAQAINFYQTAFTWARNFVYQVATPYQFPATQPGFVDFTVCSPDFMTMSADWVCDVTPGNNGKYVVTCPYLARWNGILSNGDSAFSADRMDGSRWLAAGSKLVEKPVTPQSPGSTVLVDYTCDGQLSFLPNVEGPNFAGFLTWLKIYGDSHYDPTTLFMLFAQKMTVTGLPVHALYKQAMSILKTYEQTRASKRGETLTDEAFALNFAWEQFFYDWVFAPSGKPAVDRVPQGFSSPRDFFLDLVSNDFFQITLPNSCSFSRWMTSGSCSGDYSGFGKLLGIDATIRVSVKNCGTGFANTLPAIQAMCVGAACSAVVGQPLKCDTNRDCPGGLVCTIPTTARYKIDDFDPLFLAAIVEGNPSQFAKDASANPNAGYEYYLNDVNHFLGTLKIEGTGQRVCAINYTNVYTTSTYGYFQPTPQTRDWASQAALLVGHIVNLKWFAEWLN